MLLLRADLPDKGRASCDATPACIAAAIEGKRLKTAMDIIGMQYGQPLQPLTAIAQRRYRVR